MSTHVPNLRQTSNGHRHSTIHVDNIHCQSCVDAVTAIIAAFPLHTGARVADVEKAELTISDLEVSIPNRTVSFTHPEGAPLNALLKELDIAGFDVWLDSTSLSDPLSPKAGPSRWRSLLNSFSFQRRKSVRREAAHKDICSACREPGGFTSDVNTTLDDHPKQAWYETRFAIDGMTCSSCTSAISATLSPSSEPGIRSCEVTLLPPSAIVVHNNNILLAESIREFIEDIGYGAQVVSTRSLAPAGKSVVTKSQKREPASYKAIYSISGMTCSSCVSSVTSAMQSIPGTRAVSVDLMGNTGSVIVQRKEDAELIRGEIEDSGFECTLMDVEEQYNVGNTTRPSERTVTVRIDGMFCEECIKKVNKSLGSYAHTITPLSLDNPTTSLSYKPAPPSITLRAIRDEIFSLGFTLSVVHVDSIEERAARAHAREQRHILVLFAVTLLFAIPTFTIAVVGMSLLSNNNIFRMYLSSPVWGNASRATVALFVLATPVQFGVGWFFYKRAWKSLRGVWRRRKTGAGWRRVWIKRLFRWGSMDTLVALGTSTGYFASLSLMILDIRTTPQEGMMGGEMGWFDSSVFLMLFILAGRYLESISKQRTGDAITALSSTRSSTGLVYNPTGSSTKEEPADFLEVGDTLLVPVGASPPLDAVLTASSPRTTFDESSLTGEARPVPKAPGDEVFAGTVNAGPAAAVVTVSQEVGKSMLDGIVGVVRDAMGKKAGMERIADVVTGYFVPFVVGVAALTFGVWCLRGYLGGLPAQWAVDQRGGGWVLFAVEFGVAVLVVACPCGIGLAAPTAQLVGVGLAAQNGILSNGGGEAFQTISSMNTVVLDKTGTLTTSKFTVSNSKIFTTDSAQSLVHSILRAAEQASTHPLAVGVREWCEKELGSAEKSSMRIDLISSEEIPGRGLVAVLVAEGCKIEVAIGNEKLMDEMEAKYESDSASKQAKEDLIAWQTGGKSVILLSAKLVVEASGNSLPLALTSEHHSVLGLFGVHDPPRPEASSLVAELQRLNMDVWMISGDNPITAKTVARSVGIDASRVIAGALPVDKQTWVKRLQSGDSRSEETSRRWWRGSRPSKRSIVAFCGDGINDAPAIAQADVGLAMGGGSNVAVSTADFCLLNSNLLSILAVHNIAKVTRRKIVSNFVWACLYNVTLMPLAAGAFYPFGRTKLPPVWGAAAMALSSVSVVVNSLFLRWTYRPPKVVREWRRVTQV